MKSLSGFGKKHGKSGVNELNNNASSVCNATLQQKSNVSHY
jgi:hypothetical protein